MENVYILVKFVLNEGIKIEEWKKLSDRINSDLKGVDGFNFRDSAIDENGNVYCIVKWDSIEQQKSFRKELDKKFEENPEMKKIMWRIVKMESIEMNILKLI